MVVRVRVNTYCFIDAFAISQVSTSALPIVAFHPTLGFWLVSGWFLVGFWPSHGLQR